MKITKSIITLLMSFILLVPLSTANASEPKDSLLQRATKLYPDVSTTTLHIPEQKKSKEIEYPSSYVPVTDFFGKYADRVLWNGAKKTVRIMKDGQEAVLNFSGKSIESAANQVILPTSWYRLEKGKAVIHASVLSYIFENNVQNFELLGGNYNDKERVKWRNKLAFLNIGTLTSYDGESLLTIYLSYSNIVPDSEKEKDLGEFGNRAFQVIPGWRSMLHVVKEGKQMSYTYRTSFMPVRDIFGGHVESIKWDNTAKTTTIVKNGQSVVLNFSGQAIEERANQIVLPTEWVRFEHGKSLINANVLSYIFDPYSDFSKKVDPERDEWAEKLSFLNISADGIYSAVDDYLQVFVNYNP